jgi:hypothetical protein
MRGHRRDPKEKIAELTPISLQISEMFLAIPWSGSVADVPFVETVDIWLKE